MLIDKSHSKKDIINLFLKVEVVIDKKLSKGLIINNIEEYFKDCKYNDSIKNLTELKFILQNENKRQRPNLEEKNIIMFKCKKIVKWATSNYIYDPSTYNSIGEVYNDILYIHKWGDIPSVRRACRFYNNCLDCINHVNPEISEDIQKEIQDKKILKKTIMYKIEIRRATKENPIVITFD